MTLSFASAPGNLMNRLGKVGALIKDVKSSQGTMLTAMTDTTVGVVAQLNSESDVQAIMGDNYLSILSAMGGNVGGVCQSLAIAIVNRMVFRDSPQINQTLTSTNTVASLQNIIQQMKAQSATVLAMTVTATPVVVATPNGPNFTGTGNGILNASVKRPFDGLVLENSFAENILFTCSQDSYSGNATAGNETFTVTGVGAESDLVAFDWPLGSNAQANMSAIDGNSNDTNGNLLTNSGFETWVNVTNVPDNWNLTVGTAGVNTFEEQTIVYDGDASLKIVGDGATLVTLQQEFDVSTGTLGALSAQTQYSFNIWMCRDGTIPGAGQLSVSLVDGSGNVITDAAGVANTFNINLTTLNTVFTSFTGIFRTPVIMPAQQFLQFSMPAGQALSAGRAVYLDKASLGQMTQLYTSGPFLALHSGSVPFVVSDFGMVNITNSRGAGGTLSTWQVLFFQLFNQMRSNELLLPSSNVPTISDGLIA